MSASFGGATVCSMESYLVSDEQQLRIERAAFDSRTRAKSLLSRFRLDHIHPDSPIIRSSPERSPRPSRTLPSGCKPSSDPHRRTQPPPSLAAHWQQ